MYYALIDCNNFYASCERVFNPSLRNKPVVILSNNDGCVIARSNEAKDAGIEMGVPEFKIRPFIDSKNIAVRSSNYALYGDMSARVMETLRTCTPDIEVYSIDEAFAVLSDSYFESLNDYGEWIRKRVLRWTGIPVSVGIARTKTLAKIANEKAKSLEIHSGVYVADSIRAEQDLLSSTRIDQVWGIGRKYSKKLWASGIRTAMDLSHMPDAWVRKRMKVTGLRTVWELRGRACLSLEQSTNPKKGVLSSRSFGVPVQSVQELREAVAQFASRAAEKLRAEKCAANHLTVTLVTNKFANPGQPYKFGLGAGFDSATADTRVIAGCAVQLAEELFEPQKTYKKAWVMLTGIVPETEIQASLFNSAGDTGKSRELMNCIDRVNRRHGKETLALAVTGIGSVREWEMNQNHLSRRFTTRWSDILQVR